MTQGTICKANLVSKWKEQAGNKLCHGWDKMNVGQVGDSLGYMALDVANMGVCQESIESVAIWSKK